MAAQQATLRLVIAGLETKIRDKMKAEPGCWMIKPTAANLDAEQSEQDVTYFQAVSKRPSWLKSSQF